MLEGEGLGGAGQSGVRKEGRGVEAPCWSYQQEGGCGEGARGGWERW